MIHCRLIENKSKPLQIVWCTKALSCKYHDVMELMFMKKVEVWQGCDKKHKKQVHCLSNVVKIDGGNTMLYYVPAKW